MEGDMLECTAANGAGLAPVLPDPHDRRALDGLRVDIPERQT